MLVIKLYFLCVALSSLYVFISGIISDIELRKARTNRVDIFYMSYLSWHYAPFHYKLLLIIIPGINLFFSILLFVSLWMQIRLLWFMMGRKLVYLFTRRKWARFFLLKRFIINTFFHRQINHFYNQVDKRFEELDSALSSLLNKYLEPERDEKHQSESNDKPDTTSGD